MALAGFTGLTLVWKQAWLEIAPAKSQDTLATASPVGPVDVGSTQASSLAFLKLPQVWMCFAFFFWSTAALSGIQGFATPALMSMHQLPLEQVQWLVPAYMVLGALGMVWGGFWASREQRLERLIATCLVASALMLVLVAFRVVPGPWAVWAVAFTGLGIGLAGPARDLLIKKAAPPGATGRVYGTVYSGLDLGYALAAPVFGYALDQQQPAWVLGACAIYLLFGVAASSLVGLRLIKMQRT
jgi:predicted MFS family arabinose efflux permease